MSIYSYTSNYRFRLIRYDSPTWHEDEYANWNLLDGLLDAVQDTVPFVVATGSANAFVLTYSPAITAYNVGTMISFQTNFGPTGATTVNVNGLGAKALKLSGIDLATNDILTATYVRAIYDGTSFQIITPNKRAASAGSVFLGSSGTTAAANADAFVIEDDAAVGMSFLGPNGTSQRILFGRTSLNAVGGFEYSHALDKLYITVGGATNFILDSTGVLQAVGGFIGNVAGNTAGLHVGNVTGDVTGNVTGNVTGALTGNASTATTLATGRTFTFTGDVTGTSGAFNGSAAMSTALTIANNNITNAKLSDMAANTIKGNNTGGLSDPLDLTAAQVTAMLAAVIGDSGAGGTKGLVPAPSAGDAATGKVLLANGAFGQVNLSGQTLTTSSIGPNGYAKIGSLYLQWGEVGTIAVDSSATITYPVAFPTACLALHVSPRVSTYATTMDSWPVVVGTPGASTAIVYCAASANATPIYATWFAVGY